ncbi:MAG: type II secretion system protein GspD, partial [SAR324 cluster bacterium]|nr:type II secretion system protein GspD [SAR324 cluster bacterium]
QRTQGNVEVGNGQPFLLGGLIKDSTGTSESGIPFFKDLPLLGWLFRTDSNERRFDHVMVFITPTRIVPETSPALPDFGLERGESARFSE